MAASSSKKASVPEAKEAMSRFKEEVASELGVPLKEGYNGDLTSKQAGSIGGEMVKQMIMKQEQQIEISSAIAGFKCTLQMQAIKRGRAPWVGV